MSPAIAKTSETEILAAARQLVRQNGVDGLSMRDVAEAVGIRAPSLYKRFDDREALLRAVRAQVQEEFEAVLVKAAEGHPPAQALTKIAHAYRAFARGKPRMYRILHRPELAPRGGDAPSVTRNVVSSLVGESHAAQAADCICAFLHGFVTLELDGSFTRADSKSPDEAFAFSVYVVLQGLVNSADAPSGAGRATQVV
ncbi:MAG: TetR/AcrR family transcriptional regulator [Hyphomicrobiales bacterium]|nr:TetR/AcrR family transcriptional regulator [Hyphomicrobiales bacterium]